MSKLLNSLIISARPSTQGLLETIMQDNLEGYVLSFITVSLTEMRSLDREPDIIFSENDGSLGPEHIVSIRMSFPNKTTVVLAENSDEIRTRFVRLGVDEVMSMAELQSGLGRHLLEKLIAFRNLADAEARIERSEERFRGIIEHSHDIIFLLDQEQTIIYTSPAFGRQLGYEEWEVLGQALSSFVQESDLAFLNSNFNALCSMEPTVSLPLEFHFRDKTNGWRAFEAMGTNLMSDDTVAAIVLNIRDVTEQKQTERELEDYRLHLEELVERRTNEVAEAHKQADNVIAASPDALIALDDNGYITFISRHYRMMYPRSADKLVVGRHITEAFDVVTKELKLAESDPRYAEMKTWWLNPSGYKEFRMHSGTWVRLQAKRSHDDSRIVISTTNITDYKRQQALLAAQSSELELALEKERQVVEQQKTFISMVSHEFRTPLTIIDGNAQIIERRGSTLAPPMLKHRAVTIRGAVDRLIQLIETILSAHMMEQGRLEIHRAPCSLSKIILDTVAEQQDVSPRHRIRTNIKGVPETLQLDERFMRHMMVNLLANAVKYSPSSPDIDVAAFVDAGQVVIEVQDHGVGIPESELPRIFTKYYRASTSGGIPGSGLGLNLVRQFVELHGGTIGLQSKVGMGTVVTVQLPL